MPSPPPEAVYDSRASVHRVSGERIMTGTFRRVAAFLCLLTASLPLLAGCREQPTPAASAGRTPGVTDEACPDAVNPDKGCVYLGVITDLTRGPFRSLAVPLTDAQRAFWRRVNEQGGIGGYDVDVTSHVEDSHYVAETHAAAFDGMRGDVLGLAQSLGSAQTAGILDALRDEAIVTVPASSTSAWEFEDVVVESGASYCVEMANAVDWWAEPGADPGKLMAVHFAGDYGDDAAAGARMAAERIGAEFVSHVTRTGQHNQQEAIDAVLAERPGLLVVATGPAELATILTRVHEAGLEVDVLGASPTWHPGLLNTPAREALEQRYAQAAPWGPWGASSPGHAAVREAFAGKEPNDAYVAGWVSQYPLKAALEASLEDGPLTRASLLRAVRSLKAVDTEGMLPDEAGAFAGEPAAQAFRQSVVNRVDRSQPTGLRVDADFFAGPTARAMPFTEPCFQG